MFAIPTGVARCGLDQNSLARVDEALLLSTIDHGEGNAESKENSVVSTHNTEQEALHHEHPHFTDIATGATLTDP